MQICITTKNAFIMSDAKIVLFLFYTCTLALTVFLFSCSSVQHLFGFPLHGICIYNPYSPTVLCK